MLGYLTPTDLHSHIYIYIPSFFAKNSIYFTYTLHSFRTYFTYILNILHTQLHIYITYIASTIAWLFYIYFTYIASTITYVFHILFIHTFTYISFTISHTLHVCFTTTVDSQSRIVHLTYSNPEMVAHMIWKVKSLDILNDNRRG